MPDIAQLNLPAAAANDAPSRSVKVDQHAKNADSGALDADNAAPSSFQDSLSKAQAKTGVDHEPGGKPLPETETTAGKQVTVDAASATGERQTVAVLAETGILPTAENDTTALSAAVPASADTLAADEQNPNVQNPLQSIIEPPAPALLTEEQAVDPQDAGDQLDAIETDIDALAALSAGQPNGVAQQAVKKIATSTDDALSGAANQTAQVRTQSAMQSVAVEDGASQSGAESDMLFKLSMQAIADAPASGLQGGAAQSTTTLSSVNTMQALLQPDAALRGDNPALSANPTNALASGQGANPASATGSGAAPALMSGHIATPFGKPEWGEALGKQVLMMVNQNTRSAEIRMNPANLGPIEIQIDMQDDQVNVAFTSRHAVVREAMEQAMPRLREMLDNNGLSLAESNVSDQSFAEQREFAFAGNRHGGEHHASGFASPIADDMPVDMSASASMQALSSAMLDVYI